MPRGGKREGAGRRSGKAWGGSASRPAVIRELASERVREVLATASDPLAILVEIANDRTVDVKLRVMAASAAAPFIFPKLSAAVVATVPAGEREDTAALVDRLMHRFNRIALPAPAPATFPAVATIDGDTVSNAAGVT